MSGCPDCGHAWEHHRSDGAQTRCLREECRPDTGGDWCLRTPSEPAECPWCGTTFDELDDLTAHIGQRHVGGISRSGYNPRPDEDPVYRRDMKDAGRGHLLR